MAKKRKIMTYSILILLFACAACALYAFHEFRSNFDLPFEVSDVESVLLAYENENQTLHITSYEQISKVTSAFDHMQVVAQQSAAEAKESPLLLGGSYFDVTFQLANGSQKTYQFFQTSNAYHGGGILEVDQQRYEVRKLNLVNLWKNLS